MDVVLWFLAGVAIACIIWLPVCKMQEEINETIRNLDRLVDVVSKLVDNL